MALRNNNNPCTKIKELIRLLGKYNFFDSNIIAEDSIQKLFDNINKSNLDNSESYEIPSPEVISFHVNSSKMQPNPGLCDNKVKLILSLKYKLDTSQSDIVNIIPDYQLELEMQGIRQDDKKSSVNFAWHLDREDNVNGHFIHPLFHFHAGGRKIKGLSTGNLLMLGSPRIPHPPMDIILAINFVILNFFNSDIFKTQRKILSCPEYVRLVKDSEKTILTPYFHCINNGIGRANNCFPIYI